MAKPKITTATIIKLVIACFLVGAVLTYYQLTPKDVVIMVVDYGKDLANWSFTTFGSLMSYVMLGAALVVPIWLIFYLWGATRGDEDGEDNGDDQTKAIGKMK